MQATKAKAPEVSEQEMRNRLIFTSFLMSEINLSLMSHNKASVTVEFTKDSDVCIDLVHNTADNLRSMGAKIVLVSKSDKDIIISVEI